MRRAAVADRVARAFAPIACVRGFWYFVRGRVHLTSVADAAVDAEVKGKRTRRVRLRASGEQLGASCTCCTKRPGPATCRHVWAALLEIDRQGELAAVRGSARPLALAALER